MTRRTPTRIALSASMVVLAQAASAQVTAADVWESYESWFSGLGLTVVARTEASDGILTVSDIVLGFEQSLTVPGFDFSISVPYPDMTLIEQGDGSVLVTSPSRFSGQLSAEMSIDFGFGQPESMVLAFDLETRSEDERVLVTGTPEDMVFQRGARMMDVFVGNLRTISPDPPVSGMPVDLDFDFTMGITVFDNDITTRMRRVDGGTRLEFENHTGQTIVSVSTSYVVDQWWDDEFDTFTNRDVSVAEATAATGSMFLPDFSPDLHDIAKLLRDGFEFEYLSSTVDHLAQGVSYENDTLVAEQELRYGTIRQRLSVSDAGLAATLGAADLRLRHKEIMLPWDIEMSIEAIDFSMVMPLLASPETQRASLGFQVTELSASDPMWAALDPRVLLPRDPISLEVDISVLLNVLNDLVDFERLFEFGPGVSPPLDVVGIEAETITFDGLGVTLDADGSLSFPSGIVRARTGVPFHPMGHTRLDLSGANALLDALVELDVLLPTDARDARMGLALIGKSTGIDSITSEVEFTEGGGIIINGQPMQ